MAAHQPNVEVKGWLAAVEAEVQAVRGNGPASLEALKYAAQCELPSSSSRDSFWIQFDPARLGGYQGVCYLQLAQHDDKHSIQFVDRAQTIFGSTIESLEKTGKERRSTIYADFAQTFALQGDSKQACKYGTECFHILAQRNFGSSSVAIARLQALKKQLSAQKRTAEIEEFRLLLNALPV